MHVDLKFNLILEWYDHKVGWVRVNLKPLVSPISFGSFVNNTGGSGSAQKLQIISKAQPNLDISEIR